MENRYLFSRKKSCSWKIGIMPSRQKEVLPENWYNLFGSYKGAFENMVLLESYPKTNDTNL